MSRLIDADALIEALRAKEYETVKHPTFLRSEFEEGFSRGINIAKEAIMIAPNKKMSDLIDRQMAIEEFEKELSAKYNKRELAISFVGIKSILEKLPSAQPERKRGMWIDEKINSYTSRIYCSECGSSAPFVYKSDDYYGNHAHGETAKTKYCPNCGARMDNEVENAVN